MVCKLPEQFFGVLHGNYLQHETGSKMELSLNTFCYLIPNYFSLRTFCNKRSTIVFLISTGTFSYSETYSSTGIT